MSLQGPFSFRPPVSVSFLSTAPSGRIYCAHPGIPQVVWHPMQIFFHVALVHVNSSALEHVTEEMKCDLSTCPCGCSSMEDLENSEKKRYLFKNSLFYLNSILSNIHTCTLCVWIKSTIHSLPVIAPHLLLFFPLNFMCFLSLLLSL